MIESCHTYVGLSRPLCLLHSISCHCLPPDREAW